MKLINSIFFGGLNKKGAIITDYITPHMAERLKEMEIPYLDTAGNVYLKTPKNFIYVTGRKKPQGLTPQGHNRAFRAAGLKVIFILMTLPGAVEGTNT